LIYGIENVEMILSVIVERLAERSLDMAKILLIWNFLGEFGDLGCMHFKAYQKLLEVFFGGHS